MRPAQRRGLLTRPKRIELSVSGAVLFLEARGIPPARNPTLHAVPLRFVSFLTVFVGATLAAERPAPETGSRPNVLLIAIDDLNDWVRVLGGHPQVQTPNTMRLWHLAAPCAFCDTRTACPIGKGSTSRRRTRFRNSKPRVTAKGSNHRTHSTRRRRDPKDSNRALCSCALRLCVCVNPTSATGG